MSLRGRLHLVRGCLVVVIAGLAVSGVRASPSSVQLRRRERDDPRFGRMAA